MCRIDHVLNLDQQSFSWGDVVVEIGAEEDRVVQKW